MLMPYFQTFYICTFWQSKQANGGYLPLRSGHVESTGASCSGGDGGEAMWKQWRNFRALALGRWRWIQGFSQWLPTHTFWVPIFPECVARVPVSLGGLGVRLCSPSFAFAFATVGNRSQPSATICVSAVRLSTVASASGAVPKACQVE